MSGETPAIVPPMKWAQRSDRVYLTIEVSDCKDSDLKFKENGLSFKAKGGDGKKYECDLEFFGDVDVEKSVHRVMSRQIPCTVMKKEEGPFWPRLLKAKGKAHFLHTDFNLWVDEDDSDTEGGANPMAPDANFEEMMAKMGDFNPADAGGAEEPDSDDEDLPDLE